MLLLLLKLYSCGQMKAWLKGRWKIYNQIFSLRRQLCFWENWESWEIRFSKQFNQNIKWLGKCENYENEIVNRWNAKWCESWWRKWFSVCEGMTVNIFHLLKVALHTTNLVKKSHQNVKWWLVKDKGLKMWMWWKWKFVNRLNVKWYNSTQRAEQKLAKGWLWIY